MSCYHPMYCAYQGLSASGKPQYKILGAWTGVKNHPQDISVPCGHCIGCRLDKSREWADRMMLELDHSKTAVFLTLTYDQDHVPIAMLNDDSEPFYTLCKRDFQLFMKRLRKYFSGKEIRFYAAGEYGDHTFRPHYHAILFGIDTADFPDLVRFGSNPFGQPYYTSDILARLWSNGFVSLAPVSWQTCAYVARYCTKKLDGDLSILYAYRNCVPPFALMSRRPGIAGYYAVDHPELLSESKQYVSDLNGLKKITKVSTPKYLFEKLELTNPSLYYKIKSDRARFARDKLLIELSKTDLDLFEYNKVREANKTSSVQALKRSSI